MKSPVKRYVCSRCSAPESAHTPEGLCTDCRTYLDGRITNHIGGTKARTHTLDQLDRPELYENDPGLF